MTARGYRAYVQVYDESIYVDTFSGEGFDKVMVKINPLLCKFASTTYIANSSFEDVKNELSILALEGIRAFEPFRNVKLSTFLQTHLHNKIISKIKSDNKMSHDAYGLYEKNSDNLSKLKKVRSEIHFSQFSKPGTDAENISFESSIPDDGGLHSSGFSNYDLVDFETSLLKISSKLDWKTRKIIELVYFEDYSIKDAAEHVGLTGWAASMRLKKLAIRGAFKTIFEQDDLEKVMGPCPDFDDFEN